jgi:hypothetical protein
MPTKKERKLPKVGSIWEKSFKNRRYVMKVVAAPNGIAYEVDGRRFDSPSAAANNITKTAVNGWIFWKIEKKVN